MGISVTFGIALLFIICWSRSEPKYQGRSLSFWLRGFESDVMETRWQSADAIRCIGTNALPFLTARLRHQQSNREPGWKQKFWMWLSKQSIIKTKVPRPGDERLQALAALDALGPVAKDAMPAVEGLLREKPPDPRAILVLARFGPEAVPVLTRALTNDQRIIRTEARVCLDLLQSHSDVLFPKTAQDAEFMRRTCEFNLKVLGRAFEEYRAQHPDEFLPTGAGGRPTLRLSPGVYPSDTPKTNYFKTAVLNPSPGFE